MNLDFADRIRELALRCQGQLDHLETEEATKNALVMPFINALGYDVFNPLEVTPELHADVGIKRGEKVDYAILIDGKPVILIECKSCHANLDKSNISQLYRYFTATDARFGVLTNGVTYRFFTDLDKPNAMDSKHFFEFNLFAAGDGDLAELKKFSKPSFDLEQILTTASQLKYVREVKHFMARQLSEPSESFVRLIASEVYPGRLTQAVKEELAPIIKRSLQQFVSERIKDRLQLALSQEDASVGAAAIESEPSENDHDFELLTTEAELQGYYIVKAILSPVIDVRRIAMRDVKTYCGVLLDDNNRKPICRLWFNARQKYLGIFDADKNETRFPIDRVDDLYAYADRLTATLVAYERDGG